MIKDFCVSFWVTTLRWSHLLMTCQYLFGGSASFHINPISSLLFLQPSIMIIFCALVPNRGSLLNKTEKGLIPQICSIRDELILQFLVFKPNHNHNYICLKSQDQFFLKPSAFKSTHAHALYQSVFSKSPTAI